MIAQIVGFKDFAYDELLNKKTGETVPAGRSFKIFFHDDSKPAGQIDILKIDPQLWQPEFLSCGEEGFFNVEIENEIERFQNGRMKETVKGIKLK